MLLIATVITFWSCGDLNYTEPELGSIGIGDAEAILLKEIDDSWYYELFTIENDNSFNQLTYFDQFETQIPTTGDVENYNRINSEYSFINVCLEYEDSKGSQYIDGSYVVRHSDGTVFPLSNTFDLPSITPSNYYYFRNTENIQKDNYGNYYYISEYDQNLLKMDFSDPENPTTEIYIPASSGIKNFKVSPEGNVIYGYDTGTGDTYFRIKKVNGQLETLSVSSTYALPYWIGLDGKIKYHESGKIYTITIDPETYELTSTNTDVTLNSIDSVNDFLLTLSDRIIAIDIYHNYINEYENPTDSPRTISVSGISIITNAGASSDYYYLSGYNSSNECVLLRVNSDNTSVDWITPDTYDIDYFEVKEDNTILFYGTKMTDGSMKLCKIDSSGNITELASDDSCSFKKIVLINK